MSASYAPILKSILTSSIWDEAPHVKVVWLTMLVLADSNGNVDGSLPGLARTAAVTREQCQDALSRLMAPDPDSRTKEHDGRRIVEVDGGWHLLNHAKHKGKIEKAAEQNRERQRRFRERMAEQETDSHSVAPNVTVTLPNVTPLGLDLGSDLSGSQIRDTQSAEPKKQGPAKEPESEEISCPPTLALTTEQRAVLETAMIPGWAIDAITTSFVSTNLAGSDPRPLVAWRKCLAKAISGTWNSGNRPKKPEALDKSRMTAIRDDGWVKEPGDANWTKRLGGVPKELLPRPGEIRYVESLPSREAMLQRRATEAARGQQT